MKRVLVGVLGSLSAACATAVRAEAVDVPRFGVFEESLTHTGAYSNPYAEVTASATFTRPGGGTEAIPLFWDGAATWRVRFSPDVTGVWGWSVSSGDAGLHGQSGSFNCVASSHRGGITATPSAPYHFQYEDGTPFWWMGDTMWRAGEKAPSENLDRDAYYHYVDVRASQGFNYVHSNLGRCKLRLLDGGGNEGGTMWDGSTGAKPTPGYFRELDSRIQYTNSKGIVMGYFLGWSQDWKDYAGQADRLRYARYVVARYSAYNVVFVVAGEYNEELSSADYVRIGQEIEANDPHDRMTSIHATGEVETFAGEPWMDFGDYQQTYTDLHSAIISARDHNKPVVNSEYAYYLRDSDGDGVVDKPNSATLEEIRNATWDIVMAGGYFVTGWGTTYHGGYRDPGPFDVDASKNDPWEDDVRHVKALFTSLRWWTLQPRDDLVTGLGTRYCLAETGQQYVAFVRGNAGTNELSLGGGTAATYAVRRFDPRTGGSSPLPDYTGTGPVTLDPPDGQDWVFVLTNKDISNRPPAASISADRTTVAPGEAVTFTAVASDPDGTIASHIWHWGDADESVAGVPAASKSHSWSSVGEYEAYLSVTDDGSPALTADSNAVTVIVTDNRPPTITAAGAAPDSGEAPLAVDFSASATDPEGDTLTYRWDFDGDGTYDATGRTTGYTYDAPGHYDPVVRVSDGAHSVTQQLTVDVEPGTAGWDGEPASPGFGCVAGSSRPRCALPLLVAVSLLACACRPPVRVR